MPTTMQAVSDSSFWLKVLPLLLSSSFLTALFTWWMNRRKFASEKWWERKAAAYTDLVERLYSCTLYNREIAKMFSGEILMDEARKQELTERYTAALAELRKAVVVGDFLFSRIVVSMLEAMFAEKVDDEQPTYDMLTQIADKQQRTLDAIRMFAKDDLGVR